MPPEPGKLVAEIRKCLAKRAEGDLTEFLRKVRQAAGREAALPVQADEEVLRFLHRLGYLDAKKAGKRTSGRTLDLVEREARAAGLQKVEVSVLLRAFASGIYAVVRSGVCTDTPDCPACPFVKECRRAAQRMAVPGESPAERMFSLGPRALSTAELTAAVLDAKDASATAHLVEEGLRGLAQMTPHELSRRRGVGKRKAVRLLAAMELGRRWAEERKGPARQFRCGRDFYDEYRLRLRDQKKEQFICILLDQKNRLIRDDLVSLGGLASSQVHPREVFRSAIRESAAAVAFVHNHPSGDAKPSEEDKLLTQRLATVAGLVGVRLLDHVVVGDGEFFSFFEEGLL